jgi:hypothetical protein
MTVAHASTEAGHAGQSPIHLVLLGTVEIGGALLFLFRRTQLAGLVLLLTVFAIAALMTALLGDNPLRFFYYAATALFIFAVDRSSAMELAAGKR